MPSHASVRRKTSPSTITDALTERRLDLLAYRVGARLRVDLCCEALTVDLDPTKHGIVPSGVLLVAALLPAETHACELVLGIACGIHQQVFVRLVQREVLQLIESGLWYGSCRTPTANLFRCTSSYSTSIERDTIAR